MNYHTSETFHTYFNSHYCLNYLTQKRPRCLYPAKLLQQSIPERKEPWIWIQMRLRCIRLECVILRRGESSSLSASQQHPDRHLPPTDPKNTHMCGVHEYAWKKRVEKRPDGPVELLHGDIKRLVTYKRWRNSLTLRHDQ